MKVILALFLGAFLSSVSPQGFSPYRQVSRQEFPLGIVISRNFLKKSSRNYSDNRENYQSNSQQARKQFSFFSEFLRTSMNDDRKATREMRAHLRLKIPEKTLKVAFESRIGG